MNPDRVWTPERIAAATQEDVLKMADAIVGGAQDYFRGKNPQAVGVALAHLVAQWIAGHPCASHKTLGNLFMQMVNEDVPTIHEALWATATTRQ